MGVESCIEQSGTKLIAWLSNPQQRPEPDIRNFVYYYGMAAVGNENRWNQVWEIFLSEQDAQEKSKLMYGLAGIQVPWILKRSND